MDLQERIVELDPNLLQANPLQPRGIISPDSLQELVESIKEQGILEPIVVAHELGHWLFGAGHHMIANRSCIMHYANPRPQLCDLHEQRLDDLLRASRRL